MFGAWARRLLLALVAVLALAACDVDVDVSLDVAHDGSGTVQVVARFDAAAVAVLGDLDQGLRLADAERAGWEVVVDAPEAGEGIGGADTIVTATKPVTSEDQWQPTLDEIAGPGVFDDVQITSGDDEQQIRFDLDLGDGWTLFADNDVTAALDGQAFGVPIEELTDGRAIDEIVDVAVDVTIRHLEDGVPSTVAVSPRFDDPTATEVDVTAVEANSTADLVRWISWSLFFLAALAFVLAVTGVVLQRRSDRLRPAPTPKKLASRVPGRASAEASAGPTAAGAAAGGAPRAGAAPRGAAAAAGAPGSRPRETVRLVVIEPLAVLYGETRSLDEVVLPFVRERGGSARADTIEDGHRSLLAGAMTTAAFWELCGVHGDADDLDAALVAERKLHSGVRSFFAEMQRRRIPVAATTDDASAWSARVRERDRLSTVWPWLVSADVGTVTTNMAMFEVLRRESSVAYSHCLYVDSDLEALDAAKELGMRTALFDTGELDLPAVVGHPTIADLKALFVKD